MKLQDHLHYRFKKQIITTKKQFFYQKNGRCWKKTNGNNVGSQKQKIQLTSNENMISYCQLTMQSLMECYEIVRKIKK